MVRNDDTIKTPDDLKGRKVGISTVGSVTSWMITEISRRKGWGVDGMEQVPVGDDSSRIAALRTHSIDAAIVNLAVALKFVQSGDGRILLRFTDLLKDFHTHVIFATDTAIAEKPAVLREFLEGWFETVAFMRKNKAKTMAVAQEIMQTDDATTSGIYDELMPMFSDDGRFNPEALKVLSRSFVEMKVLPAEPDMSKLYTTEFLPKE
jgi:ABC-type nitrate/sulfonate/bicarbonate transport system substrate-binding protein